MTKWSKWAWCLLVLALGLAPAVASAKPARGSQAVRPHGRVLSQRAEVRSGPGFSHRTIAVLERDETVQVIERGKRGGFTRVQLETGVTGFVLTEQIELFGPEPAPEELGPFRRFGRLLRDKVLGPPSLMTSRVTGALSAGALDREGLFLVRPGVLLSPHVSIEGYFGPSAGRSVSRGLFGVGPNIYLSPGIPFTPYISVGFGAAFTRNKADVLGNAQWSYLASPGGGIWIIFKRGVGVRVDVRNHVLFRADVASSKLEVSGALAFSF